MSAGIGDADRRSVPATAADRRRETPTESPNNIREQTDRIRPWEEAW